jgi:hypothetical protein
LKGKDTATRKRTHSISLSASQKTVAPKLETYYVVIMRIMTKKMLGEFREIYPDAEQALRAWHTKTKQADAEIKVASQKRYRLHGKG